MNLEELLFKIDKAYKKGLPFVIYRKPNTDTVKAFCQFNNHLHYLESYSQKGFVFAPFNDKDKTVFLPDEKCENFEVKIGEYKTQNYHKVENTVRNHTDKNTQENHINRIEKGIDYIKKGEVLKVVLSRTEEVSLQQLDIVNIFNKLIYKYLSAFVYVWYHPKVGLWLGASPETLLRISQNKFLTMALAGTKPFKGSEKVIWDKKEKEEQQIVTDYIINKLSNLEIKYTKPFTLKAGNLLHICTEISGKLTSEDQLEKLLRLLHPTPAVCGMPKDKAKEFIFKNEGYDREFYTGYLGELNRENQSHLFVNLRCMQFKKQNAIVYVGGGITYDSIAEKEWEETVEKSKTLMSVL